MTLFATPKTPFDLDVPNSLMGDPKADSWAAEILCGPQFGHVCLKGVIQIIRDTGGGGPQNVKLTFLLFKKLFKYF